MNSVNRDPGLRPSLTETALQAEGGTRPRRADIPGLRPSLTETALQVEKCTRPLVTTFASAPGFCSHQPMPPQREATLGEAPRPAGAGADAAGLVEQAVLLLLSGEPG